VFRSRLAFALVAASLFAACECATLPDAQWRCASEADCAPGEACIALTAELVDWRARTLLGRHGFERRVPVAEESAEAAAAATSRAVGALLDALAPWVESLAAASGRPGGAGA